VTSAERAQIEMWLGRPLTDDELESVPTSSDLTESHARVLAHLYRKKSGTALVMYIHHVVPSAGIHGAHRFVAEYDGPPSNDSTSGNLRMLSTYEHFLGRKMNRDEQQRQNSLQDLSAKQRIVARELARGDSIVAISYLTEIVKGSSGHERERMIQALSAGTKA